MKRWYFAGGIFLAAVCVLCMGMLLLPKKKSTSEVEARIAAELDSRENERKENEKSEEKNGPINNSDKNFEASEENYVSPIDFKALQEENPDIYAWLYLPDTGISYPILQREDDGTFYLDHNSECEEDKNGALFSESKYNGRDFTDPVTVIYGHHMRSGAMFGQLQALYSESDSLEKYREMFVYLPEEEQKYEAFAALPFESDHILYYYDFSQESDYLSFLNRIYAVRQMGAKTDSVRRADPDDQLLILSTCLSGNNKKRYLVLAKRIDDKK